MKQLFKLPLNEQEKYKRNVWKPHKLILFVDINYKKMKKAKKFFLFVLA